MAEATLLRDAWLVAGWPGMGNVAVLAGGHLVQELQPVRAGHVDPRGYFEVQGVQVSGGIASAGRLPRSMFFEWRNPAGGRDLLIFVGEAQPTTHGYAMCREVADHAAARGVRRVCTFAALATQMDLGQVPRVFGVATDAATLKEVGDAGIDPLTDGQVGGLNGLMLAAAAERGLSGVCLLAEIPFYAANAPNPRAAAAALERFTALTGVEVDRSELLTQADAVEGQLAEFLERMGAEGGLGGEDDDEEEDTTDEKPAEGGGGGEAPELDPKTARRIETLFEQAKVDPSKAVELKRELDRAGVFKRYENRFLDLFRRAG
jgi:predicted ATP-grasp superfamily ATP-dependent carboligase